MQERLARGTAGDDQVQSPLVLQLEVPDGSPVRADDAKDVRLDAAGGVRVALLLQPVAVLFDGEATGLGRLMTAAVPGLGSRRHGLLPVSSRDGASPDVEALTDGECSQERAGEAGGEQSDPLHAAS